MSGFAWIEYFKLAQRLALETDEASQRCAVSRCYYYVFHLALARAMSNSYQPSRMGTSHKDLWLIYDASPLQECRELALLGKRMKDRRVMADYDAHFPRLAETLPNVLKDAERFAALLVRLNPRHPRI